MRSTALIEIRDRPEQGTPALTSAASETFRRSGERESVPPGFAHEPDSILPDRPLLMDFAARRDNGSVTGLEPTEYIAPDSVQSGDPRERGRSFYIDRTGQLDAGVWECEPNRHAIDAAPYDEFVYLLEGEVDVIDDDGAVESYRAGDSFVMPRDCQCTWDVRTPVRKLYVVLAAEAYPEWST